MSEERQSPTKIRIGKLQEVQVPDLVRIDRECSAMYHELGFDAAEVPARTESDFYKLPRNHAVRVAEADGQVAGYAAWRDESPGVAYLEELSVAPGLQRFGVGSKLLARVLEEARENGFGELVLRTWDRAEWARSFYRHHGFADVGAEAPEKVRAWLEEKTAGGRPFLRPGERILWCATGLDASDDD